VLSYFCDNKNTYSYAVGIIGIADPDKLYCFFVKCNIFDIC